MGRCGFALVVLAMGLPQAALGQSPIAMASRVETGWTSNATDSAAGGQDFYTSHSHDMSLTAQTDIMLLRGSLSISQTAFATTTFENDTAVAGAIEARFAPDASTMLRLGFAATQGWLGDDISIAGLTLPVRSTKTEHEYLAELTLLGADQQVTVSVAADWTLPGNSMIEGLGLPPLRLSPQVGSVTGLLAWERALSPSMALLMDMETWFTLIPEDDQMTYARASADGGRLAAGLRLLQGAWSLEGKGGVDLVWPKGFAEMTQVLPHIALTAAVTPMTGLTLGLNAATDVELVDPLDSVAGRTAAVDLNASWAVTPAVALSAALGAQQEWGLYDTSLSRTVRMASLGLTYAASNQFRYGATVSWAEHVDPSERYDKTGIALSISGDF